MKMKRFLGLSLLGIFAATSFGATFAFKSNVVYVPTFATYTNGDAATYYNGISESLSGTQLLTELQSLNSSKRRSTVGYSAMGTSASGQFKYTDYDPSTVRYDSNNQPYGTRILSFYSGNSTTSFNREHVWPQSHGGKKVEADIHMPRPTIPSENGSRGNSFYVENKCDGKYGWDPKMESFGDETYRGDSARIIFYCVVAYNGYDLVDLEYHSTSNANPDYLMGKLSDMLSWNQRYPVTQREKNRNEGAEYLQGNRNPFIDHPEYACRIWGNYNEATKAACSSQPVPVDATLSSISITSYPTKRTYKVGESLDKTGMVVKATFSDGSSTDVSNDDLVVNPSKFEEAGSIAVGISYTYKNVTKSQTFVVEVKANAAKGGCAGDVVNTSIILSSIALAGVALVAISRHLYKKKEK